MRTKWLMGASAVLMAVLGLAATFLPQEIALRFGGDRESFAVVLLQITGGLYIGFAMLNWSARDSVIGGIYNRPIVLGNLLHFTVVALALLKVLARGRREAELIPVTLLYVLFAAGFGWAMWSSPARESSR